MKSKEKWPKQFLYYLDKEDLTGKIKKKKKQV